MARLGLSGAVLTRAVGLLLVVCLAECAAGSCLSYGHSCWGAHGKRSSARAQQPLAPSEAARLSALGDRWFFSRLLRPQLREQDLSLLAALTMNRQALDANNDSDMFQHRRALKENSDMEDERRDYVSGRINSSENIEDQPEEKSPLDVMYMDDNRLEKANYLQGLKDNSAGLP